MDEKFYDEKDFEDLLNSPINKDASEDRLSVDDVFLPFDSSESPDLEFLKPFSLEHSISKGGERSRLRWSASENQLLRKLCQSNPTKDWEFFALYFPSHTPKQVRRHYYVLRKTWETRESKPELEDTPKSKLEFLKELRDKVGALETHLNSSSDLLQGIIRKYAP